MILIEKQKEMLRFIIYNMLVSKILKKNISTFLSTSRTLQETQDKVIMKQDSRIVYDFEKMNQPNSKIDSIVILNNKLNERWLSKGLNCTDNVVLADGGANRFY